jgi:hypothetical protein
MFHIISPCRVTFPMSCDFYNAMLLSLCRATFSMPCYNHHASYYNHHASCYNHHASIPCITINMPQNKTNMFRITIAVPRITTTMPRVTTTMPRVTTTMPPYLVLQLICLKIKPTCFVLQLLCLVLQPPSLVLQPPCLMLKSSNRSCFVLHHHAWYYIILSCLGVITCLGLQMCLGLQTCLGYLVLQRCFGSFHLNTGSFTLPLIRPPCFQFRYSIMLLIHPTCLLLFSAVFCSFTLLFIRLKFSTRLEFSQSTMDCSIIPSGFFYYLWAWILSFLSVMPVVFTSC